MSLRHVTFVGQGVGILGRLRTNAAGQIALVSDMQELEEAIRLILGTAYGERPMRPEFGCGIHDLLFASVDSETAGRVAYEVRASLARWEPRIEVLGVDVSTRPRQPGADVHRHPLHAGDAPTTRATWSSRSMSSPRKAEPGEPTMTLPVPNLDDRRFQDLVDDAKRLIQQRCPEWTDHNVSDPGVTLIETFAWMTDLLLYRLNRVPDRNYIKFLELIGVRLFAPTAARAPSHVLAVGAAAGYGHHPGRDRSGHSAHRH